MPPSSTTAVSISDIIFATCGGTASRRTFLLDDDGDLLLEYPVVAVGTHPAEVLDDCLLLFGD